MKNQKLNIIKSVDFEFHTENKSFSEKQIENWEFQDTEAELQKKHGKENIDFVRDKENNKIHFILLDHPKLKCFVIKYTDKKTGAIEYIKTWARSKTEALKNFCLLEFTNVSKLTFNAREISKELFNLDAAKLFNHLYVN